MSKTRLNNAVKGHNKKLQRADEILYGTLGIILNGVQVVQVPNRYPYVYIQLRNDQNELVQAYNDQVSAIYGFPVTLIWSGNRYEVTGRDSLRYNNWGSNNPYLPFHGASHSFDGLPYDGTDVVWVYPKQFMPFLAMPSGANNGSSLIINPYIRQRLDGTWSYDGATGMVSFATYLPTTGSLACMALVYMDASTNKFGVAVGSGGYFSNTITGTNQIAQYIPPVTNPNWEPITAVRLVSGTTQLTWDNLYDVRQFVQPRVTGSAGGGSGITIGQVMAVQGVGL